MFQVALVEEGAATLPRQRGTLPRLRLRQLGDQRVAFLLVHGTQQQFQIALTADEFFFLAGAAFEAAHQMLDAFLACGNHFADANFVRDVAGNRNSDLVRFGGGGPIGVVGNHRLHLDEIDALGLQRVDRGCGASGSGDSDGAGETQLAVWKRSIEHRAGNHHARANDVSSGNLLAPSE